MSLASRPRPLTELRSDIPDETGELHSHKASPESLRAEASGALKIK